MLLCLTSRTSGGFSFQDGRKQWLRVLETIYHICFSKSERKRAFVKGWKIMTRVFCFLQLLLQSSPKTGVQTTAHVEGTPQSSQNLKEFGWVQHGKKTLFTPFKSDLNIIAFHLYFLCVCGIGYIRLHWKNTWEKNNSKSLLQLWVSEVSFSLLVVARR